MDMITGKLGRAGAALLFATLTGCAHHGHHAHGQRGGEGGGISVSGSGEAHSAPDIARLTAGVEVRAATPDEAVSLATTQMEGLLSGLKAAGIAATDLRTQNYSVSYERDYQPVPQPLPTAKPTRGVAAAAAPVTPPGRYLVTNSVEITVRKVSELGKILATATSSGANNVWGISFDIENREPLITRARQDAFAQARTRAESIAAVSGVKLGPIVAIDDGSSGGVVAPVFARAMAMDSAVPVERGELTVSHQVRVQYAIAGAADHPPPPPPPAAAPAPAPVVVTPAPAAPPPAPAAPPPAPSAPAPAPAAPAPAAAVPPAALPAVPPAPAAPSATVAPAPRSAASTSVASPAVAPAAPRPIAAPAAVSTPAPKPVAPAASAPAAPGAPPAPSVSGSVGTR